VLIDAPGLQKGFVALFRVRPRDATYISIGARGFAELRTPFAVFLAASAAGALIVLAGFRRSRSHLISGGLAMVSLAGVSLFTGTIRPQLARMRTLGGFAIHARQLIDDSPLYVTDINYELSYYDGRALPILRDRPGPTPSSPSSPVYLAASLPQVARLPPAMRRRLKALIVGGADGGPNSFSLYEIESPGDSR
jgi:hypothetical protein